MCVKLGMPQLIVEWTSICAATGQWIRPVSWSHPGVTIILLICLSSCLLRHNAASPNLTVLIWCLSVILKCLIPVIFFSITIILGISYTLQMILANTVYLGPIPNSEHCEFSTFFMNYIQCCCLECTVSSVALLFSETTWCMFSYLNFFMLLFVVILA